MSYSLFLATARDNHGSRALIATRLLTLGLLAPWRNWMTTGCSFTFTTTVRMVNRVHHHTANGRTNTAPTHCTCFTNLTQTMFSIANFTNSRTALDVYATNLT
jgi:hypothetical protein